MKFIRMAQPLKYDVCVGRNRKVVIPAGTPHVEIAFKQSPFKYFDKEKNKHVPFNVYRINGQLIHA